MTRIITKGLIGLEDINTGSSTFSRATSTGGSQTLTKVNITNLGLGMINVKDYGAKGDGSTDDTTAVQNAENAASAGGYSLYFPPGTYMINNTGILKLTGVSWFGAGKYASVVKGKSQAWTGSLVSGVTITNASYFNLGFDLSANSNTNNAACLAMASFSNGEISFCNFLQKQIGIEISSGTRFSIHDNSILQASATSATSIGIWVRTVSGSTTYYSAYGNNVKNTGTEFDGDSAQITGNTIIGTGFGAGIASDQGSTRFLIANNICSSSTGIDANAVTPSGIENWSTNAVIVGNSCNFNAGAGIHSGGAASVVAGNECRENGTYSGAGVITSYRCGIISRYFSSSYNGGSSVITGNICIDSGAGTQLWGYVDEAGSGGITLTDNILIGATAPMSTSGTRYDFKGPKLSLTQTGLTGGTISSAASGLGATAQTLSGAALGDKVTVSMSVNMQGLIGYGWVPATNQVSYAFFNPTGGGITIGTYTAYVQVEKPFNYANY